MSRSSRGVSFIFHELTFFYPQRPGYIGALLDATSSHEFAHFLEISLTKKTHFYDYLDADRNMRAYGQASPPLYNVSKVVSQPIAIWFGNADNLVPAVGVRDLIDDLRVPVEQHFIDKPGVFWNHYSYFIAENEIPSLLTVPSVMFLESNPGED